MDFPEILFIMDDYDLTLEALALDDRILTQLGKMIRQDTDLGFHFLIAGHTDNLSNDPLIRQLKLARSGISLANTDTFERLGGRPTAAMRSEELPSGRGYFLSRSGYRLVQFGLPNTYDAVLEKWKEFPRAEWQRAATETEIQQVRNESVTTPNSSYSSASQSRHGSLIDMEKAVELYKLQQQRIKKGL